MSFLQTKIFSHGEKVRSLYRAALRNVLSYYPLRHEYRYHACLLRARFDEHKNEVDMVRAKQLLKEGEEELWLKQHPVPFYYANSPGGSAYGREVPSPDWLLDMWHPLEKAQYPEYFAKRDQRKKEFMERWDKKYGGREVGEKLE